MVLLYCDFWAPILKILSNYLIFIVAFVTWDKHIDKYIRWAHIIVSQWYNLTQGYIWHICQFRWLFLVLHLIPWVTTTGCAILLSMYQIKYYFQYQTHQSRKSNIISSTSHTSQMIFPVPDTPNPNVKYIHAKNVWCCGDGYFGQKKFAEKVRKSRQNVNRDKSA